MHWVEFVPTTLCSDLGLLAIGHSLHPTFFIRSASTRGECPGLELPVQAYKSAYPLVVYRLAGSKPPLPPSWFTVSDRHR
jgi:hypothetical protein